MKWTGGESGDGRVAVIALGVLCILCILLCWQCGRILDGVAGW